jgi:deoxyribonuclease-1
LRRFVAAICLSLLSSPALASGWAKTKNIADDIIYDGRDTTFYCGCEYTSHEDSNGSGDITDTAACGYQGPSTHSADAEEVHWEHVVPASLMPAREFDCWTMPGGSRRNCQETDPRAQGMIFDLHNLVPSIGQVNKLRSNDRNGVLPDDTSDFGGCPIEDADGIFEPPDCHKGDVARIWLYMHARHGVEIPPDEKQMFMQWSAMDPVSEWESLREERIADYSRVINPFVHDVAPEAAGACPWE